MFLLIDNTFILYFSCCGIAVECPVLYEVYNITWSPNHTTYSHNDIVHFQCDDGYQLSGPSSLVCQAEGHESIGRWSNKQPACVGKHLLRVKVAIYTLLIQKIKHVAELCTTHISFSYSEVIRKYCQKIECYRIEVHARPHAPTQRVSFQDLHISPIAIFDS